jgi:Domain of Unknown Function with PDB structure (DUF3857)
MKKIIFLLGFCAFFNQIQAQIELDAYSASTIPKELLTNAHAVVRRFDVSFSIKDIGTAVEKEHKIVTILDEQAKHYGEAYFWYDKMTEIDDIEAAIYDASGKLVRKMKRKDIDDFKPFAEDISDNKIKKVNFPHLPYPYTVEYTVTTIHKGLLFYPNWNPQNNNSTAVQSSTFEVTVPNGMPTLRYKLLSGASEPTTGQTEKGKRYLWTLSKYKAFADEPFTPSSASNVPKVLLAPTDFSVEGYTGNMKTWQSFGAFLTKLNDNRSEISAEKKQFLKELVADCPDIPCKVEKIYSHLQATTRYFSIQLGIGGWQPFAATDVEKRKYSDCKGLSNYMVAMLKSVGIEGRYGLIWRGEGEQAQFEDFPNATFNHAIACVPMKNDTIWLECTSQDLACGYLDNSDNRKALLVTPEGGKLVQTPRYDENVSFIKKTATVTLNTEGEATTETLITYSGLKQNIAAQLTEINADTRKKYVYETLKIDNATINDMSFIRKKTRIPVVEQKLNLTIAPLASKSGKRLFLPINIFSKWTSVPSTDSTRLFQVQADDNGFTEQDSVTFQLPDGYKPETKPTPLSITSLFGSFEMSVIEKSPTELVFYRKLILNNKILPKEKFPELVEFLKNVAKADKGKLILVKTTS